MCAFVNNWKMGSVFNRFFLHLKWVSGSGVQMVVASN